MLRVAFFRRTLSQALRQSFRRNNAFVVPASSPALRNLQDTPLPIQAPPHPDRTNSLWQPHNDCRMRFYRAGRGPPRGFKYPSMDEEENEDDESGPRRKQKGFYGMKIEGFEFDPNEEAGAFDGNPGDFFKRRREVEGEEEEDGKRRPLTEMEKQKEDERKERERFFKGFKVKVIDVNRTFKVTKGGGEISFTALVICGNGKGVAGFAKAKGPKASRAVRKACKRALANLHYFERYKGHTIYQYSEAKFKKTKVRLWPEWSSGYYRAGGLVNSILKLVGISTIKSKLIGNAHPHNTVKATFKALGQIQTPEDLREKYWRAVVERHLLVDADGKPCPDGKYTPWVL